MLCETYATSPPNASCRPSDAGRLTLRYIAALSAVALLSLAGQAVVRIYFNRQLSDSQVVNIAGRQRMLSQRIAKAALIVSSTSDPADRELHRRELGQTVELWQRCHRGLQQGDAELGLPDDKSKVVKQMFEELEPSFRGMLAPAERLGASHAGRQPTPLPSVDVAEILRHEPEFLQGMDTIVSEYAAEASRRVVQVERIELGLLLVTLGVLLLEGLFVFRPAVRRIRTMLGALEATGAKLAAARDAAESASRAKSRFLAVTSHELRSPLHAILGIAEQLQKTPLGDSQRQGLGVVQDAGKTLLALVNDLLDLARIDSGKLELRMQAAPLASVLDGVLALARPAALNKGLDLSAKLAPDLPAAIVTDPLRLGQVLLNLLGNAVKFTDRGSVRLAVARRSRRDDVAQLRFSVADTGIGIPPAERERIFQSFTQVDASRHRASGGAGLGLAIARSLVELLGGKLEVESEIGRGSCFSFDLDCHVAETSAAGPEPELRARSNGTYKNSGTCETGENGETDASCKSRTFHQSKGGTNGRPFPRTPLCSVLVVDDAAANRFLAAAMLRGAGCEVDVASSGGEAMRSVAAKSYRAILLDVHMPGMDGVEVARAVRQFELDVGRDRSRIIALTADTLPETGASLLRNSIDVVLHKPASEEAILAAIAGSRRPEPSGGRPLARLAGNRALLADLGSLFVQEAASQRAVIEDGLQRADGHAVWRAVHRLRGQALMFDADDLCQLLAEIEENASASRLPSCGPTWAAASRRLEALCEVLSANIV